MEKLITVGIPFAFGLCMALWGGLPGLGILCFCWVIAFENLNSVA